MSKKKRKAAGRPGPASPTERRANARVETRQVSDTSSRGSSFARSNIGLAIAVVAFLGVLISGYLAYVHYQDVSALCLPGMECDEVLSSPYAQLWDVPLSLLGMGMYLVLVALGTLIRLWPGDRQGLLALGAYAVALSATLFSLYLYYLEIFEIEAFCTWCVASSLVVFTLMALTLVHLRAVRRT